MVNTKQVGIYRHAGVANFLLESAASILRISLLRGCFGSEWIFVGYYLTQIFAFRREHLVKSDFLISEIWHTTRLRILASWILKLTQWLKISQGRFLYTGKWTPVTIFLTRVKWKSRCLSLLINFRSSTQLTKNRVFLVHPPFHIYGYLKNFETRKLDIQTTSATNSV